MEADGEKAKAIKCPPEMVSLVCVPVKCKMTSEYLRYLTLAKECPWQITSRNLFFKEPKKKMRNSKVFLRRVSKKKKRL